MTSARQAASHNRAHNGTAAAIRDVLRKAHEPMSCEQIAMATGIKREKVKTALAQMMVVSGGIVSSKSPRGVVYAMYRPPERTQEKERMVAGRIEIGRGMRWSR